MKKIRITVEKTNTGYSAGAEKLPVYTAGDSLKEIRINMVDAINLHFDDPDRTVKASDLDLVLDLNSYFNHYRVINAKALSERLGMNQSLLAQYIKGIKRPSPKQTLRIMKGVNQLGKELTELRFLI